MPRFLASMAAAGIGFGMLSADTERLCLSGAINFIKPRGGGPVPVPGEGEPELDPGAVLTPEGRG